jgi:hypothetical protein
MPAAPWRQSQISPATVGWQARFDLRFGDFIEDKRVAGCAIRCEETSGLPADLPSRCIEAANRKPAPYCEIRNRCGTRRGNISLDFSIMEIESDYDRCT